MKRLIAIVIAFLLSVAALSSCTVSRSARSTPVASVTDAAETTEGETERPERTTDAETETAPVQTGDGYSKNY